MAVCIGGVFFAASISTQLKQTRGELGTKKVVTAKLVEVKANGLRPCYMSRNLILGKYLIELQKIWFNTEGNFNLVWCKFNYYSS